MDTYAQVRAAVISAARKLQALGYLPATGGNLSARVPGAEAFAITPSSFDYGKMQPEDICILDLELGVIQGERKPSVESALHATVYRERTDVGGVVHTHQSCASALALVRSPIPALFDEQARYLGRKVEVIPYAPSGTGLLARAVRKCVRSRNNAYILANHGVLCLGTDLERAANNAEILEKVAVAYLLALCTERKVFRIPVAIREVAVSKLHAEQKKTGR